jgi:hypothetical protein
LKPFFIFLSNPIINQHALKMQEVSREDLVPGKEYYMQCFERSCAPPMKPYKMIAKFEKLVDTNPDHTVFPWQWAYFTKFRNLKYKNDATYGRRVQLNLAWRFYEIPRDKVQKNMENRAYNMVLLDVIGDEHFKPVEVI